MISFLSNYIELKLIFVDAFLLPQTKEGSYRNSVNTCQQNRPLKIFLRSFKQVFYLQFGIIAKNYDTDTQLG
jgi:hypothetical protein